MLHTINKSPFDKNTFDICISHAKKGSSILLIEDGVYAVMKGTAYEGKVKDTMKDVKVYVLGPDAKARGIDDSSIIDGIESVDYVGFVELTANHDSVQSWL
ncbi:MAG: sulfurtransferase complex subunit TusB [Methylococcales bacterium]|nr:sulfurtransferase complex subunit TusB [Methylococcales bacterium]